MEKNETEPTESGFKCCNPKFNNCPRADRVGDKIVVTGDDGSVVEFEPSQFEVLLTRGGELLR